MEIIKGNQLEMKNTLSDMRSILIGINKVNKEEDKWPIERMGKPRKLNQNGKKKEAKTRIEI